MHIKLLSEEDYRRYPSQTLEIVPLQRAITDLQDVACGGEEDLVIPEQKGRDGWWYVCSLAAFEQMFNFS